MRPERVVSNVLVGAFVVLALTCFSFAVARTTEGRYPIAAAFVVFGVVLVCMAKLAAAEFDRLLDAIEEAEGEVVSHELITRCERCYGEGRIGFFGLLASIECPSCGGTGHVAPHPMREPVVYALREQTDDQLEEGPS